MDYELEKEFKEFISGLLEKGIINNREADYLTAFTELYVDFQEKSGKTKEEIYNEIGNEIGKRLLENIIEKKGGKFLDQKLLKLLEEVPGIKLSEIKGLTPSRMTYEKLFQLAVFGLTEDKFITTGYLKNKPEDPYIPTNLCFALLNLGNLVDDEDLRSIVLNKVLELYGLKRGSYSLPTNISAGIRDKFYQYLKYLLYRIKWTFRENVEDLQDSLVFYNRSLALYSPEAGSMNIFSTSSGIVIPEEYRGDQIKKKNPYRRKYFNVGIGSPNAYQLPKYYQWDSEVTAKNLWKRYLEAKKSREYIDEAVGVLAKFLQVPNLEITEAPFREEPWKVFFTLVSDKTLVLSERGEARKINHGFMVDEDVLKTEKSVYDQIASLLGKTENGIIGNIKSIYKRGEFRIYKRLDEVCSAPKEARERARDVVELLLERGKLLERKEEQVKPPVITVPPKEKVEEEKEYDIYINGELRHMTRNEVEELESRKSEYLAWAWVDDEKSEVIIDKVNRDIKPDSIAFNFLREILKKVGKDLLHDTIYKEVPEIKKGSIHQNLNKLKEKTGHVLDKYITGEKRFRFSISKFKSCLIMKKKK